ncbi:lactate utilization protein C [Vibrio hannami]|uniref:LutC/YkgG family protein n=1 Tax=Vibrio hannami TaxID=2717094 RepID=UPI00240FDCCD|nr:lactate utilization protein C [Vibrio hannami]MDG3087751.1 lactate utilization protein C [Vibrio hannami]
MSNQEILGHKINTASERIIKRDDFLANIAQKLGRTDTPQSVERPPLRYTCHHDVMAEYTQDELKQALVDYTQTTLASQAVVTTQENLSVTLREVCEAYCLAGEEKVGKLADVLFSSDARLQVLLDSGQIESDYYQISLWNSHIDYQGNIDIAERAKVGVVYAEQALAESGTMVLYSQPDQGRAVSLLPEASVFIVAKSALVPRLSQATAVLHQKAAEGERMPSCVNFISGPSSTADIELIKVVGVHGPVYATYIIIDDI